MQCFFLVAAPIQWDMLPLSFRSVETIKRPNKPETCGLVLVNAQTNVLDVRMCSNYFNIILCSVQKSNLDETKFKTCFAMYTKHIQRTIPLKYSLNIFACPIVQVTTWVTSRSCMTRCYYSGS